MSDAHGKKKALGRGLSALLENPDTGTAPEHSDELFIAGNFRMVRIEQIEQNPFQPRTHFSETELQELSGSIREHGLIQPITLRKVDTGRYQLISGERRLRASQIAGLTEIPAYIRLANDEQMLEMALVENIQREDLNPLEIALSFQRLLDECKIRQEDLSQKVGKDRSTISNYIRLLKLPTEIQVAVRDNLITMGHARALVSAGDEKNQLVLLRDILENKLSVRQVEERVRQNGTEKPPARKSVTRMPLPVSFNDGKELLKRKLAARIDLKLNGNGGGKIVITFRTDEEFQQILSKL